MLPSGSRLIAIESPERHKEVPVQQSDPVGAVNQPKPADAFRNYAAEERAAVREFYRQNHTHQTLDFVLAEEARVPRARTAGRWASGRRWST